jgi:hypothetical protein
MTVEDIEKAVAKLLPDQLAKFRAWFDEFNAAKAGKLDGMADQAICDFRNRHHRA